MTRRRLLLCVLIFVGLSSVYMIFYSADYREFGDSLEFGFGKRAR